MPRARSLTSHQANEEGGRPGGRNHWNAIEGRVAVSGCRVQLEANRPPVANAFKLP
jgi:hypothetical protein